MPGVGLAFWDEVLQLLSRDPDDAGTDADGGEGTFVYEFVDGGAADVQQAGRIRDGDLLLVFEFGAGSSCLCESCLVPAVLSLRAVPSKCTACWGAVDLAGGVGDEALPTDDARSLFDLHRFLHFPPIFCAVARLGEPSWRIWR